jgi:hypothetical protein
MLKIKKEDLWDEIDSTPKKSRKLKIILLIILVFTTIFAVYYFKTKRHKATNGFLPLIKADNSDFKIKPYDPGGMIVPNMDKTIYDNFSSKPNKDRQEKILPPPEEPVDRAKYLGLEDLVEDTDKILKDIAPAKKENKEVVAYNLPKPPEKKDPKEKGYMLQLASFKSYKVALVGVDEIKKKHAKLIKSYKIYIEKKDIEYNKQFYRLQIGPIANESEARLICKKFKNEGQDCMMIKP